MWLFQFRFSLFFQRFEEQRQHRTWDGSARRTGGGQLQRLCPRSRSLQTAQEEHGEEQAQRARGQTQM